MELLLSHVTGCQNSRQVAKAFSETGWSVECHHTLAWKGNSWLSQALRTLIGRRLYPELERCTLIRHPWPAIAREIARKLGSSCLVSAVSRHFSPRLIAHRFDASVAKRLRLSPAPNFVYGYIDSSLQSFQAAHQKGIRCIYELPTPYWRTVWREVEEARQRYPNWAHTLPPGCLFKSLGSQRDDELRLADLIIVPSNFVRDSLSEAPPFKAPIVVVPYAAPTACASPPLLPSPPGSPLKILFAGTISQTKGIADLLSAAKDLGDLVMLSIAGAATPVLNPPAASIRLPSFARQLGQLTHEDLKREMLSHHVFVLPTLYEGMSLAILEAMSCGMAVVTTDKSGFKDLIENGRQGFIVPPMRPEALREVLHQLILQPELLFSCRAEALTWSRERDWQKYRATICSTVSDSLIQPPQ